jgi:hypothetical protein
VGWPTHAFAEIALSGRRGRVGVAVVAWSVVDNPEDAAPVAGTLEAMPQIDLVFDHDIGPRRLALSIGDDQ